MASRISVSAAVLLVCSAHVASVAAQPVPGQHRAEPAPAAIRQLAAVSEGDLRGTVLDDAGQPVAGAVVSVVGATSAFAVSERDGSFVFRHLPAGPYLLRAHLKGFVPPRARMVQVNGASQSISTIAMGARTGAAPDAQPKVLEAGMGGTTPEAAPEPSVPEQGELAWRIRHLRRSVLKDVDVDALGASGQSEAPSDIASTFMDLGRSAASFVTALPFSGRVDLLTSTSFAHAQDLFSLDVAAPRGVTSVALNAPGEMGDWTIRAGLTQGDLTAWVVSGSYLQRQTSSHQLQAGVSYAAQRYLGGNTYTLGSFTDGSRNVGEAFVADHWTPGSHVQLDYGVRYARYDYLNQRGLLSPNARLTWAPDPDSSVRLRAGASRREIAPGAEEFLAPANGVWLPAERTFASLSTTGTGGGFGRERVDTVEVSAERQWVGDFSIAVKAFRQRVDGQIVTLFGENQPQAPVASIGHYYVGSAGDLNARGWGVGVSRAVGSGLRASVEYSQTDVEWDRRPSPDAARLAQLAPSTLRTGEERLFDLTTSLESEVQQTGTRLFVIYKINSAFASDDALAGKAPGARFEVQVNQAVPFLNFSASQWEMLFAIRNIFRDALADGSAYDELLVVRAPKRIVGGLTVRF